MPKYRVSDQGTVTIDSKDYESGASVPSTVKVPKWMVEQGYLTADDDDVKARARDQAANDEEA